MGVLNLDNFGKIGPRWILNFPLSAFTFYPAGSVRYHQTTMGSQVGHEDTALVSVSGLTSNLVLLSTFKMKHDTYLPIFCLPACIAQFGGMLKIWFSAGVGHITQCGHWRVNVNIISDLISQPCPLLRQTAPCSAQRAADNINLLKEIEKERELSLERTGWAWWQWCNTISRQAARTASRV